jgi:hyperosmotically inducible periplasmic protein
MKRMLPALLVIASAAACNSGHDATGTQTDRAPAADNTDKNERDRSTTLTPGDQNENETDRKITQQIRQEVVGTDELSTDAKNVKIITADGTVTLRGPVKSQQEKADIARIAQKVSGVKRLDNQLEIASN